MSNSLLPESMDPLKAKAEQLLTIPEYNMLVAYMENGKHQLAPDTAAKMFELYLSGSDCKEIHRLNKPYPYEAILWARIKYGWDEKRDEYASELTKQVQQKVIKASLETTALLTDILAVANKKHGDRLKKYLQTGDEEELGNVMQVDTLSALIRAVEGLQKITGQDKVQKIDKKETVNVNVSVSGGDLTPKTSAAILAAIAEEKRERSRNEKE